MAARAQYRGERGGTGGLIPETFPHHHTGQLESNACGLSGNQEKLPKNSQICLFFWLKMANSWQFFLIF